MSALPHKVSGNFQLGLEDEDQAGAGHVCLHQRSSNLRQMRQAAAGLESNECRHIQDALLGFESQAPLCLRNLLLGQGLPVSGCFVVRVRRSGLQDAELQGDGWARNKIPCESVWLWIYSGALGTGTGVPFLITLRHIFSRLKIPFRGRFVICFFGSLLSTNMTPDVSGSWKTMFP